VEVDAGERLHGWYLPGRGDRSPTGRVVLFCHGNGGNISHRLETAKMVTDLGSDMFLFDYRGYGRSGGSPGEAAVYADALACYDWLRREKGWPPSAIIVFGRSLGGAVAIDLAAKRECGGLIVESSLTSTAAMARRMFPFYPAQYLVRYRFEGLAKIPSVNCPVLVTHSPDDEVIPYDMGRRLYEAAGQPRSFLDLRGGHNERDYLYDLEYRRAVGRLLGAKGD
jgi:fermentation-respiration switch protein FrsA (DUF1100 family)